jgi:hypothetical protein
MNPSPKNTKQSPIEYAKEISITSKNYTNKHVLWNVKSPKVI